MKFAQGAKPNVMLKLRRYALFAWSLAHVGCMLSLAGCSHALSDKGTNVGQSALSFRLPSLKGGTDEINGHAGRVVVVNLWATWCPPCREELPTLERVAALERGRALILGVDQGENLRLVRELVTRNKLTYEMLLDHDQVYGANYATIGLPTTVVLDTNGKIRTVMNGAQDQATFVRVIEAAQKP